MFCAGTLVGVNELEEGDTDHATGFVAHVDGEGGIEVEELEGGIEEGPVCGGRR